MNGWSARIVGLTGLGLALSACVASPQYPIREGEAPGGGIEQIAPRYPVQAEAAPPASPPPAAPPASESDAPRAAPSGEVTSSTLAPPPGAVAAADPSTGASVAPVLRPTEPAPRLNDRPIPYTDYLKAKRAAVSPTTAAGTGSTPVVTASEAPVSTPPAPLPSADSPASRSSAVRSPWPTPVAALETPRSVTVQPGETVLDIAERLRTPVQAIVELNGLSPPYALTPGSTLRIPPPLVYAVAPGDTLFGVAKRFNIDPRSLANLNDMPMEARLSPGQQVALPTLARDQGQNPEAKGISPHGSRSPSYTYARPSRGSRPSGPVRSAGIYSTPRDPAIAPQAPMIEAPQASDAQVASLGRGRFIWPLRGTLISAFGDKGVGQRNDGLNIAVTVGDPVKAAAAGEVVYAGNSIPGFGNLVLVKHSGGWVTAYAHLDHLEVRMRQTVTQGEQIGEAGQTGAVDRPQLHFEIRYSATPAQKARPVDPASLLPAA